MHVMSSTTAKRKTRRHSSPCCRLVDLYNIFPIRVVTYQTLLESATRYVLMPGNYNEFLCRNTCAAEERSNIGFLSCPRTTITLNHSSPRYQNAEIASRCRNKVANVTSSFRCRRGMTSLVGFGRFDISTT
jgi:hypothetical protein